MDGATPLNTRPATDRGLSEADRALIVATFGHCPKEGESLLINRFGLSALLAAARREGEWRPIETAPKPKEDAPRVAVLLAWTNREGPGGVGEGYWNEGDSANQGWWWANLGPGDYYADNIENSITGRITHWMPMPAPPSNEQGERA